MLFNSFQFLIFFPIVVVAYFALPNRRRWILLLGASYYFYMSWVPEYLLLIVFSTLVDYFTGIQLGKTQNRTIRKLLLGLSLTVNLGMLFTFKYFNFFRDAIERTLNVLNWSIPDAAPELDLLLPVGISFYTFQTLSYTIDVFRGKLQPEKHLGMFALYVSFFPQLVAGPIERATRLIPQLNEDVHFDYARVVSGLQLILWGFFKKLIIADRIAVMVNTVYNDPYSYSGYPLILATYLFTFQIFCDFSAYSDIAIGCARILGYDLMENFRQPYFARSISEFWNRWHISLSTWFRDYLYIPLGGNRVSKVRWQINLAIVFVVSGLWHGANYTFLIWGGLHAFYMVAEIQIKALAAKFITRDFSKSKLVYFLQTIAVFHLVAFAWIFFRANTIGGALHIVTNLLSFNSEQSLGYVVNTLFNDNSFYNDFYVALIAIGLMKLFYLVHEKKGFWEMLTASPRSLRWSFYYAIILILIFFGEFSANEEFIYFQF